ncbi:glutamate decarboxylase/sphingosine phosphate lyase [Heterobasidion irregulare TC 32-1]|uniref:sphinganine-1-phosphate aldolase n=1 Tax=Heterobasidion irregulare (strain TC 32-1) TaxID=747525 RepID=W4K5P7_HETIT|nr:glutamate decarboxylase/sphingosine phosphate lyase [Heterobasidion irregulare TC 32-1]ETW81089.1 glutamate decarboxylase/sphingosine phosphate lyase [Heterobasidion irregulare TC 32-1]
MRTPEMKKKVAKEMGQARTDIDARLVPQGPNVTRHLALPQQSKSLEWILDEMATMDNESKSHTNYREGKLSGAVYHGGEDMEKVIIAAFQRYCVSNPLHPDVFPAVRKMDAEVVAMCLRMYNNPDGAGVSTSGGTESIIMSVKTHRDWARAVKGITEPEMVVPASAHAAFDKASAYLKIKLHSIPVDRITRQVDLKRMLRAINTNTIMIVGSAINFPDGCQDDIVKLGKLAKKYNIGLHVDCCLGGFIMPFLEKAGFPVQPFDFRVEGVTSISCDTHKARYFNSLLGWHLSHICLLGSSVIMYRTPELRQYMYYVNPEWSGGVYASPGFSGSRPGALIAGAWAAMQYMGEEGYVASCRDIVGAAKSIEHTIKSDIPELYILGNPPASVVAFGSRRPDVNVLDVGDAMAKKGWHLNALQNPPAVHIACTRLTVPVVDTFIQDLKESVREVKGKPAGKGTMVALYGLGQSSAIGPKMVGSLASAFLDALYKA